MNQRTKLALKIMQIDNDIGLHESAGCTGEKLKELRRERFWLAAQMRNLAVEDGGVHREEANREPDGDLLWA